MTRPHKLLLEVIQGNRHVRGVLENGIHHISKLLRRRPIQFLGYSHEVQEFIIIERAICVSIVGIESCENTVLVVLESQTERNVRPLEEYSRGMME